MIERDRIGIEGKIIGCVVGMLGKIGKKLRVNTKQEREKRRTSVGTSNYNETVL